MPDVRMVFWRALTDADFFNIERSRAAAPAGGGGQSYVSISFRGLTHDDLGRFLNLDPPSLVEDVRPAVELPAVGVLGEPEVLAPLNFAARYRLPHADDRYRITTQNRQFQSRHPAWVSARGFPQAPDDLRRRDPRMPDLSFVKLCVVLTSDGEYLATFTNTDTAPQAFPPALAPLFEPYQSANSAGVVEFEPGSFTLDQWIDVLPQLSGSAELISRTAPEIGQVREETRIAAGKRPSGQGRKIDPLERRAIELHAMDMATAHLAAEGWAVEDVSHHRPYDLECARGAEELRVEVKGTTGDGSAVLLTPGEVRHAREQHPGVALMIVSEVEIVRDEQSEPTAHGGRLEVISPWEIDADGELTPTGFEYARNPSV